MNFWKKQIKAIVVFAVATAMVVIYTVSYDNILKPTYIDLTEASTDPVFMGYEGQGLIETTAVLQDDFDTSSKRLKKFYDSLYFEVSPYEYLSNGEEVIVTAVYDEDYAMKYNIQVIGVKRTVKVSGLTKRYADSTELSKAVITKLKDDSQAYLQERYGKEGTYTFQVGYYQLGRSEESIVGPLDNVVLLYKVDNAETKAYVAVSSTKEINSDTDYDNLKMQWYGEYTSLDQAELWITTLEINDVEVTHFK